MKMLLMGAVLMLSSLMIGGNMVAVAGTISKEPVLVVRDTAKPVSVKQGEQFSIVLAANPTTGYSWQLAEELDTRFLKKLGSEYQASATSQDGAAGHEIWRFVAVTAGKTTLSLQYVRPWEKDKPPAKSAVFTILVHEHEQ